MLQNLIYLFLALLLQTLTAHAQSIRNLNITSASNVYLHQSTITKVTYQQGNEERLASQSKLDNGNLTINENSSTDVHVYSNLASLQNINNTGNAYINSDVSLSNEAINIDNQSTGVLTLSLQTNSCNVNNSGSGVIVLLGNAKNIVLNNAGSGSINANDLKSENIMANLQGSGDILIASEGSVNIAKSGSGNIIDSGINKENTAAINDSQMESNIENKSDTIRMKFGNKEVFIIDKNAPLASDSSAKTDKKQSKNKSRKADWKGIEFGLLDWRDASGNSLSGTFHKNKNTLKSTTLNVNFYEKTFGTSLLKLVTGAGLSFAYYRFAAPFAPSNDAGFSIMTQDSFAVNKKIKLITSSLAVPLMFQFNTSKSKKDAIRLSAGVIGYYRFATALKIKATGERSGKIIDRSDYGLEHLRCDATVRIGYKKCYVFATYGLTNLFTNNAFDRLNITASTTDIRVAQQDVRPLTIGISILGL